MKRMIWVILIAGLVASCATVNRRSVEKEALELLKTGDEKSFAQMLKSWPDASYFQDEDGATLLHHAVWEGSQQIARLLINEGVDVNAKRNDGYTPLHWAAYKGNVSISSLLLENGAEVDPKAETGATPLHLASSKGNTRIVEILLENGANINAVKKEGGRPIDLAEGEPESLLALAEEYGNKRGVIAFKYGEDILPLYDIYGSSVLQALEEKGKAALKEGKPKLPPYGQSAIVIDRSFDYMEEPYFSVEVENIGKGDLFQLTGEVKVVPDLPLSNKTLYFGWISPGEEVVREIRLSGLSKEYIGTEINIIITFSELNGYEPPEQAGKIDINKVDKRWLYKYFNELKVKDIAYINNIGFVKTEDLEDIIALYRNELETEDFIELALTTAISSELVKKFIFYKKNLAVEDLITLEKNRKIEKPDIGKYVLANARDISQLDLRNLVVDGWIGRTEIDKLVRYDRISYTIDDLLFFCKRKAISQDVLEYVLVKDKVLYSPSDIVEISENNYISRNVVEALYLGGAAFGSSQIRRLISLGAFTLPEILYTYTINDGDSPRSVGNKDGMIQVREGVDFTYIIKNDSVFDLKDIRFEVEIGSGNIDLFGNKALIGEMKYGETKEVTTTIAVKPDFRDDVINLKLKISNDFFGTLLKEDHRVSVGREVGSRIIALNTKVVSKSNISVLSGASKEAPELASLSSGAVFDVVGELDGFYKVKVFGQYGWIKKENTEKYTEQKEVHFIVENVKEKDFETSFEEWTRGAKEVLWDEFESLFEEEPFIQRAFVNAKPELVILSPHNNDEVYNRVKLELVSIDRVFGIKSIDIKVNGSRLPGSTEKGLKVVDKNIAVIRKTYDLLLKKGDNRVEVTAYNKKNIASATKILRLISLGVKNPPRLYLLSVGVSKYENTEQNLAYSARDAMTIARIFESQRTYGLYESVDTKLLIDEEATRENIKNGINYFLSDARRQDVVFLFFSGHGVTDPRGRYYFLGHDADMINPSANGIKESDFGDDLIASIQAKKVVVMLDSCYSGGIKGRKGADNITEVVEKLSEATGFIFISASRKNEYAYEDPSWESGAFTMAIKEALAEKKADADNNGFIGIHELNQYVYDRVIEITDSRQHPSISGEGIESYEFFAVRQLKKR